MKFHKFIFGLLDDFFKKYDVINPCNSDMCNDDFFLFPINLKNIYFLKALKKLGIVFLIP